MIQTSDSGFRSGFTSISGKKLNLSYWPGNGSSQNVHNKFFSSERAEEYKIGRKQDNFRFLDSVYISSSSSVLSLWIVGWQTQIHDEGNVQLPRKCLKNSWLEGSFTQSQVCKSFKELHMYGGILKVLSNSERVKPDLQQVWESLTGFLTSLEVLQSFKPALKNFKESHRISNRSPKESQKVLGILSRVWNDLCLKRES